MEAEYLKMILAKKEKRGYDVNSVYMNDMSVSQHHKIDTLGILPRSSIRVWMSPRDLLRIKIKDPLRSMFYTHTKFEDPPRRMFCKHRKLKSNKGFKKQVIPLSFWYLGNSLLAGPFDQPGWTDYLDILFFFTPTHSGKLIVERSLALVIEARLKDLADLESFLFLKGCIWIFTSECSHQMHT